MRIGLLTGGGDVPGLNAAIKSAVNRIADQGHEVVGIRRGWAGLVDTRPEDEAPESLVTLDPASVRTVDRTGGTFLHTARTNPAKVDVSEVPSFLKGPAEGTVDLTSHVLDVIEAHRIDVLIPIGGDDTLSYALRLHTEGVPVVAIPKTMDNDVHGTDYAIGFSTAVTRGVQYIHQLRTATASHERIAVVELFGRYSGETSLVTAYLAGADRAIISEVPYDIERLAALLMEDKAANPSRYAVMTISEGARPVGGIPVEAGESDAYGHRKLGGIGAMTGEALRSITAQGIVYQQLAYLLRSGPPDSLDLMVAINYAVTASDLAMDGTHGRMVALRSGTYTHVPISVTGEGVKRADVEELYDKEAYRPIVRHVLGKPMFLY